MTDGFEINKNNQSNAPDTGPSTMQCPCCRRLYSVEPQAIMRAAKPPEFRCIECGEKFSARATVSEGSLIVVDTFTDTRADARADANTPSLVDRTINARGKSPRERRAIEEVPLRALRKPEPALDLVVCPKCGEENPPRSAECLKCGLIFAKYQIVDETLERKLTPEVTRRELAFLWDDVLAGYTDEKLHWKFIRACAAHNALAFAANKYQRILMASPHESIATKMRNEVIALASFSATHPTVELKWSFRVPMINNVILAVGSAAVTTGLILPGLLSVAGFGASMVAVGLGLRWAFRPKV